MTKLQWCWMVLVGFWLMGVGDANAAQGERCRRGDRVSVTDLSMVPAIVVQGQRVRAWTVKLDFDGHRDCHMDLEIVDGERRVVAREDNLPLRRGANELKLRPAEKYEFDKAELCLRVRVNLEGTRTETDANKKFCARRKNAWTLD